MGYKVIMFDLWFTLAKIKDLQEITKDIQSKLGDKRFKILKQEFINWHKVESSNQDFLKRIDSKIQIKKEELESIKKYISPSNFEKYSETDEVLSKLKEKGFKLVLITNSPPTSKSSFKKMHLEKYFDKIIFSCEVGYLKPQKEIYELAINSFPFQKSEILMVGDSFEKDVQAANDAGIKGLLIDRENKSDKRPRIHNLKDLLDL